MTARLAILVFFVTLAVYLAGLSPGAYWLDSSEFAAASFLLGIPHPPGHPLAVLLGKAATLVPLGPIAFRVGLSQALCAAASAAILVLLGANLCARARAAVGGDAAPRPVDALCGAAVALCTSLGYAVAFQAVRPEVYALHRLLAVLALWGLFRYDEHHDRRGLLLAALAMGLGLANHHFLMILVLAPVPVLMLRAPWGRLAGAVGQACCAGAAGLLLYAYLPLRAAHHPLLDWGAPTTWERFFWTVSARAFQKSLRPPAGDDGDTFGAVLEAAHPLSALLALIGIYLLIRQRPTRRLGVFLLLLVGLYVGGRAVLGFDVANPDAYGYLAVGADGVALLACAGIGALGGLASRQGSPDAPGRGPLARALLAWAPGLLLVVGGASWGASSFPRVDLSHFNDLDVIVGRWIDQAPPRARLLTSYFQTLFGVYYLQGVEGRRPDVAHLHPHFLGYPGHREDLLARHPDDPELAGMLGERWLLIPPLVAAAARRPTLLEYDTETPAALVPSIQPYGLAERIGAPLPPQQRAEQADRAEASRVALRAFLDLREPETRRNLLWRSFVSATLACQQHDMTVFQRERARTRAILGQAKSAEMDALESRCGSSSRP